MLFSGREGGRTPGFRSAAYAHKTMECVRIYDVVQAESGCSDIACRGINGVWSCGSYQLNMAYWKEYDKLGRNTHLSWSLLLSGSHFVSVYCIVLYCNSSTSTGTGVSLCTQTSTSALTTRNARGRPASFPSQQCPASSY